MNPACTSIKPSLICDGLAVRDRWPQVARRLDHGGQSGEMWAPKLVCFGRFDSQPPVARSQELVRGIPRARLVIFERSGQYPFIKEAQRFGEEARRFLAAPQEKL